jgi:hypothetical protein
MEISKQHTTYFWALRVIRMHTEARRHRSNPANSQWDAQSGCRPACLSQDLRPDGSEICNMELKTMTDIDCYYQKRAARLVLPLLQVINKLTFE